MKKGKKTLVKNKFDARYLKNLIQNAKKNWKGIDADKWLYDIRGDYK